MTYCVSHLDQFESLAPESSYEHVPPTAPVLSTDAEERKNTPLFAGCLNYFPLALAALARHSARGNAKHNPGEPLNWARGKSDDHVECIARHLIDIETYNETLGEYEDAVALLWRAAAKVQLLEEKRLNKGPSRGSSVAKKENEND